MIKVQVNNIQVWWCHNRILLCQYLYEGGTHYLKCYTNHLLFNNSTINSPKRFNDLLCFHMFIDRVPKLQREQSNSADVPCLDWGFVRSLCNSLWTHANTGRTNFEFSCHLCASASQSVTKGMCVCATFHKGNREPQVEVKAGLLH